MLSRLPSHHPHKTASSLRVSYHGPSILIGGLEIVTVGKEGTGLVLLKLPLCWSHSRMHGTSGN